MQKRDTESLSAFFEIIDSQSALADNIILSGEEFSSISREGITHGIKQYFLSRYNTTFVFVDRNDVDRCTSSLMHMLAADTDNVLTYRGVSDYIEKSLGYYHRQIAYFTALNTEFIDYRDLFQEGISKAFLGRLFGVEIEGEQGAVNTQEDHVKRILMADDVSQQKISCFFESTTMSSLLRSFHNLRDNAAADIKNMIRNMVRDNVGGKAVYTNSGYCPICEDETIFSSDNAWYRDHLYCAKCRSIPRERGLALVLERHFPQWRRMNIHESSPAERGVSLKMRKSCPGYVASQFFPGEALGKTLKGFRNENLEQQTFADESFDLVVTLDVMEHVNMPDRVMKEVARTLKPGGSYLFTVPTYKGLVESERRSLYCDDGTISHTSEPEYHGNPVSDAGSLVTFHYGYDLAEKIHEWSGMDVEVLRFHDHRHGIIGDFTEVYIATLRIC